ncbi:hypothetical protein CFOL_v3_30201 [Cephalotus follicularis]|uniref:Uncharacterized protein n=1 Tax=Cephalotus follicularis TaxID=3775 RepID=A0A1Q3D2V0_CEPFO|nr:hypothetical protein CFOL_v3_30201 [Cephalotus follicularis]
MAFIVSKSEQSFSEVVKVNPSHPEDKETQSHNPITSQLYLRSSSTHTSSHALDKEVVLKRIRRHKYLNKVRGVFQALRSSPRSAKIEQEWLDQGDAFSP